MQSQSTGIRGESNRQDIQAEYHIASVPSHVTLTDALVIMSASIPDCIGAGHATSKWRNCSSTGNANSFPFRSLSLDFSTSKVKVCNGRKRVA